jgi:hypothetical protein
MGGRGGGGQQVLIDKETPLHVSHTHTHTHTNGRVPLPFGINENIQGLTLAV